MYICNAFVEATVDDPRPSPGVVLHTTARHQAETAGLCASDSTQQRGQAGPRLAPHPGGYRGTE